MTALPLTNIDPLRAVLRRQPLGLFSDIDGTLSPIVERPEDAAVTPRSRSLLKRLIRVGVRVALITGRPLATAQAMVRLDKAAYAANHGLEYLLDGRVELTEGVERYAALVERIVSDATHLESVGVQIESKGPGVAFHYRRAPDAEAARAAILHAIESPAAQQFAISEGRKVIELRPDIQANKGTATRLLAERLEVNGILCVGDDRTDLDMFQAVKNLRDRGIEGSAVAVLSSELVTDLLAAADYTVEGVQGVEWLLGEVLKAVGGTSP
jgi:trehalose 6-phosphate phosphatase